MRTTQRLALMAFLGILVLMLAVPLSVLAVATLPDLGTAGRFGVLAASAVTNTGPTLVNGDVGVSPGTQVSGFPPGVVNGTIHSADAVSLQAQSDATNAYNVAAGQACDFNLTGQDLGAMTLTPGVYCFDTSAQLTGQLTLNGLGNPNSVFIFKIGSTLTTASNAQVVLIGQAVACNVFWQIGSSATLGTNTQFAGNILALASITLNTGASTSTGLYALNGAITLDTNAISACGLAPDPTETPTTIPTDTATATATSTNTATATATNTQTATSTSTSTVGAIATATGVPSTATSIAVATNTPPNPPTATSIAVASNTPANPPTIIPTRTPLPEATDVPTPLGTPIPTNTPVPATSVASVTAIASATDIVLPSVTAVATDIVIRTPEATASETATSTSNTATPTQAIALDTPTVLNTATPTQAIALDTPTVSVTVVSTSTPTMTVTVPGDTSITTQTTTATPTPQLFLPPTGGGQPWDGAIVLALGAALLMIGLNMRVLFRKVGIKVKADRDKV